MKNGVAEGVASDPHDTKYNIFQIILPFVMLITFNILTYDKIIQFEQTLVTQIRAQNTSQRQNSVGRFRQGSRSTISEYHHSGRGRGSNAASHNSAQNHNTVGKICILSFDKLAVFLKVSLSRKQIWKFSFEPKTNENIFVFLTYLSKMG